MTVGVVANRIPLYCPVNLLLFSVMSKATVEDLGYQVTPEQSLSKEYYVPFLNENGRENISHNFSVLNNLSLGRGIRQSVQIGERGFSFKPSEVFNFADESGRRVYLTGSPKDSNRMAFFAYDPGVQPGLEGIEATPNLRVFRRELIMKRHSLGEKSHSEHFYPEFNLKLIFSVLDVDYFPQAYSVYSLTGQGDLKKIGVKHDIYDDYLLGFDYSEGVHYGDKNSYNDFLRLITQESREAGSLQPKDLLLNIHSLDNGDSESVLTISV